MLGHGFPSFYLYMRLLSILVLGFPGLVLLGPCPRLKAIVNARIYTYPASWRQGPTGTPVNILLALTFCILGPEDVLVNLEVGTWFLGSVCITAEHIFFVLLTVKFQQLSTILSLLPAISCNGGGARLSKSSRRSSRCSFAHFPHNRLDDWLSEDEAVLEDGGRRMVVRRWC